ncbi:alpha/beta fold hydrolase [Mesonia sediminis]|uniref:Alpha/beta fold hydrolase n=1 Tax=Mesonia sediminis TaxID=1703946 RepID=A0ABW5SH07_9FLAO
MLNDSSTSVETPPAVKQKIPVYFMPGMAASPAIFEYLQLDEDRFDLVYLSWKMPEGGESLKHYVKRYLPEIKHEHPVLIGVSFGGIIVQELAQLLAVRRVIIISSIKTHLEMPRRLRWAKSMKLYKLLPTQWAQKIENLSDWPVGNYTRKRAKWYKKYLSVHQKEYLDWSLEQILHWKQEKPLPGLVHIHGTEDPIFPVKYIQNYIPVQGGTHAMIIERFRWFNEHLPAYIEQGVLVDE